MWTTVLRMSDSDSYAQLTAHIDERMLSQMYALGIYTERVRVAGTLEEGDIERYHADHTNGALEVLKDAKKVAHDSQHAPFERMIVALERSFLALEAALDTQEQKFNVALRRARAGGSQTPLEAAAGEVPLASGRLLELRGLLDFAREVHAN